MEKQQMESFIANVDKILNGELIIPEEYKYSPEEDKQLLYLAQKLTKAEYVQASRTSMEKLRSRIAPNDQLDDEDLDLVAGGINPNAILDDKGNKKGI